MRFSDMTSFPSSPQPSSTKVIIVEDDHDLRESLVKYLELEGHRVTGVGSAIEFYRAVLTDRYSLAIIDIGLPDQNGLILTDYLRNNTEMRIVILTAMASVEDRLMGYQSGADIYLSKPLDFRELSITVSNLLRRIDLPELATEPPCGVSQEEDQHREWVLTRADWSLLAPTGNVVSLTAKEVGLITLLAVSADRVSTRQEILKALDYCNDEYGNKALEAMVRRLRRKTELIADVTPIKTVHGYGYCFSVPITLR